MIHTPQEGKAPNEKKSFNLLKRNWGAEVTSSLPLVDCVGFLLGGMKEWSDRALLERSMAKW